MKVLDLHNFLQQSAGKCIIDVRSEGEFAKGRIAGACNIPLFNNVERAQVGTTYKQIGKEQAVLQGLEIVGPKMADMVRSVQSIHTSKEVYVYCWRGGMRSNSFGWLLETMGYTVYLLKAGYKSYRREVNQYLDTLHLELKVIGGCTGSGKTEIIQRLQQRGEQVIDLEKMAHHKGSAFGGLGQPEPPSKEDFDNTLYAALQKMDLTRPIWIEDESKNIGKVFLPPQLTRLIKKSPVYSIQVSEFHRVERLVKEYAIHDPSDLIRCVEKIKKRLGGLVFKEAIQALEEKRFDEFARLILFYYDRTYLKHLEMKRAQIVKEVEVIDQNYEQAIEQLLL